jgi:hypothetical protein
MELGHDQLLKSVGQLVFGLLIFFLVFFLFLHWQASGYKKYGIYVHVNDESIFKNQLEPSDTRIIDKGRKLKDAIIKMDHDIDGGDGANLGKLRWYTCGGIDCDEGWENRFLPRK